MLDSYLVSTPAEALEVAGRRPFAAALIDMNYLRDTASGEEGLRLLAALRRIDADLPVVVMTAWGSIDLAVAAMRGGAQDFIEKPWDNTRLVSVLRNQLRLGGMRRREPLSRRSCGRGGGRYLEMAAAVMSRRLCPRAAGAIRKGNSVNRVLPQQNQKHSRHGRQAG